MPSTISSQDTVGAIVVHHRNFPDILITVDRLIEDGVLPSHLVVIDNSDDTIMLSQLRAALPDQVALITVPNLGYGAAVNHGIATLFQSVTGLAYILVSTHETRPSKGTLGLLKRALDEDQVLAVVGPTLVMTRGNTLYCWSCGGIRRRFLNEPRHVGSENVFLGDLSGAVEYRAWLDGAFCLYRASVLMTMRFREDFFLYFEETELHARLGRRGYAMGWVPSATVEQSSMGVPPFLLARNLQWFQSLHGNIFQRVITVPWVIVRRFARHIYRGGPDKEIQELLRGWRSAIRR